ncbi:MAG: long-chain acyl-CoA synthetase [Parcubacteria group bacterium Gr01-1014_3]|nr:MAG: long-chain acyl-CoA synthetase [Parcubacteria group bacterium Gr01-1014_3]
MIDHESTLNDLFNRASRLYPDHPAISFFDFELSYSQLDMRAGQFANFLKKKGIGYGDRVGMILPNCPQLVIAYRGALRAGAIVVMMNPLASSDEILEMVQQTKPSIVISLKDFREHNYEIANFATYDGMLMVISLADYLPLITGMLYGAKNLVGKTWHWARNPNDIGFFVGPRWHETESCAPTKTNGEVKPSDTAVLQFTGGTTGGLKAAELTHYNLVNNANQAAAILGDLVSPESVFLGVLPIFHVYGLSVCLNIAFSHGSKVVLLPRFNAKQVIKTIISEKVNILPAIPKIFSALLKTGVSSDAYRTLRACFSGAGALDGKLKQEFQSWTGAKIFEGYGLSETSPIAMVNTPEANRDGSLGRPVPDTEAKIVDDELFIRGPQVMRGYWGKRQATHEVLDRDGWLATGDMARMDDDGFYWMTDRKKDMIKIRGENVYPSEIEKVIKRHVNVAEVAVVGIPDRDLGEKIVACVVLKDGKTKAEEILAFCRKEGLASIKIPQEVRFVKEIPKNPILGKVLKKELRAMIQKPQ